MSYSYITPEEILSGKGVRSSLWLRYRANDEWLKAQSEAGEPSGNLLWNGSFELDADGETAPLGWAFSAYEGGSGQVKICADASHGAKCFKIVQVAGAGKGGGILVSSLVPVTQLRTYLLQFHVHCTTGGTTGRVKASVWHFDGAGKPMAQYSPYVLWDGFAPVTPTRYARSFTPKPGARFVAIVFSVAEPMYQGNDSIFLDAIDIRDTVVEDAPGAITEGSTAATSWTNCGSALLALPNLGAGYALLLIEASVKTSVATSTTAFIRFRVGNDYSNEVSVTANIYASFGFLLRTELGDFATLSLVMELKAVTGTASGKKDVEKTGLVIMP
ncbi:MAG: hypothetical protein QME66_04740 [Candidatus Eisenbacteria bacterium]|nr:hypothetical protein [Candidatus Eisenbacteria bacterium]